MVCRRQSHIYLSHNVQKDFQIRILIMRSLTKYHFFTKLLQISHTHKQLIFDMFESVSTGKLYDRNIDIPITLESVNA